VLPKLCDAFLKLYTRAKNRTTSPENFSGQIPFFLIKISDLKHRQQKRKENFMAAAVSQSLIPYRLDTQLCFPKKAKSIQSMLSQHPETSYLKSDKQKQMFCFLSDCFAGRTLFAQTVEDTVILALHYTYPDPVSNLDKEVLFKNLRIAFTDIGMGGRKIQHPDPGANLAALNGRLMDLFRKVNPEVMEKIDQGLPPPPKPPRPSRLFVTKADSKDHEKV
jgi:hypothetical protein